MLFDLRISMGHGILWKEQRRAMRSGYSVKSDVWKGWNIWQRSFIKKLPSMKHGRMVCTHKQSFFPTFPTRLDLIYTKSAYVAFISYIYFPVIQTFYYSETAIIHLLNVYSV